MSALRTITKDPQETLDYTFDWSLFLPEGDTISTVAWTVPMGITNELTTNTTTSATIWLSGGTVNTDYTIANKITSTQGRIAERSIIISVVSK